MKKRSDVAVTREWSDENATTRIKDSLLFPFVNLNRTAVAIAFFDEQVERKVQGLKRRRQLSKRTDVGGVAGAVLREIDPELLERVKDRIAKGKESKPSKQQDQANCQKLSEHHQKKRASEHDKGMEL